MQSRRVVHQILAALPQPRDARKWVRRLNEMTEQPSLLWLSLGTESPSWNSNQLNRIAATLASTQQLGLRWLVVCYPLQSDAMTNKSIVDNVNEFSGYLSSFHERSYAFPSLLGGDHIRRLIQSQAIPVMAPFQVSASRQSYQLASYLDALTALQTAIPDISRCCVLRDEGSISAFQKFQTVNLQDRATDMALSNMHGTDRLCSKLAIQFLSNADSAASFLVTHPKHAGTMMTEVMKGKIPRTDSHEVDLIRLGCPIIQHTTLDDADEGRLRQLIESSFSRRLSDAYFSRLRYSRTTNLDKILVAGDYEGVAIMTRENSDFYYLDKFAVQPRARGTGIVDILWSEITSLYSSFFWRSRNENGVNPWYFERATSILRGDKWVTFAHSNPSKAYFDLAVLERVKKAINSIPPSFL